MDQTYNMKWLIEVEQIFDTFDERINLFGVFRGHGSPNRLILFQTGYCAT